MAIGTEITVVSKPEIAIGVDLDTIAFSAVGGTFTLTFDAQTTDDLAFDATAADVEAALLALSSIEEDEVTVTGDPGAYVVVFAGTLSTSTVEDITATSSLIGTPTVIATGGESSETHVIVTNTGASAVRLGGSDISSDSGYPLAAAATITLSLAASEKLYAADTDATASKVAVLVTSQGSIFAP